MNVVLSTATWPNLHYMWYVLNASSLVIDEHEFYEKQSYRNRYSIFSANGPLPVSIPIHREHSKSTCATVLLSNDTTWRQQHCHAIRSAYGKSPYFEFFAPDIFQLYEQDFVRLTDFNTAQLKLVLKLLRIKKELIFASTYVESGDFIDLRKIIHPKISFREDKRVETALSKSYYQTFHVRYAFEPNLSILDLLFNTGLESRDYLLNPNA